MKNLTRQELVALVAVVAIICTTVVSCFAIRYS